MTIKFHQLEILSPHVGESASAFYAHYGGEVVNIQGRKDTSRSAYLHYRDDVNLRFSSSLNFLPEDVDSSGEVIAALTFQTPSLADAFQHLRSKGVRVVKPPFEGEEGLQCVLRDADGLPFRILQGMDYPSANGKYGEFPPSPDELRLHHLSLLTPDLPRAQQFYENYLGLRTVFSFLEDGGGFVFLADDFFHHSSHNFLLEIIGPPHLVEREVQILERRGACFDHLCYTAPDVDKAYQRAIAQGASGVNPPYRYEGTRIAWLRSDAGLDIEIMQPIPAVIIEAALYSGKMLNGKRKVQAAYFLIVHSLGKIRRMLSNITRSKRLV